MLVGYARCSTDAQDLTTQRDALTALGVTPNRIYVDHGLDSALPGTFRY
jgi:DNA invertase Pin-like site-specific DNA recombinase